MTVAVVSAFLTNPSITDHHKHLLKAQYQSGLEPDLEFLQTCDFHDYKLFSFTMYQQNLISIGVFDNVHVHYPNLEKSMAKYQSIGSSNDPPNW